MVAKNDQKSFKNGALGVQKAIFGALGAILGCVGNALFFGSLLGRSKIDKNRSLERSGADFSLRPACEVGIRRLRAPWGQPSIKENRRFNENNDDVADLTRPGPVARRIFH